MNIFTKTLARLRRVTTKQVIVASVFALAVVGAAGAGMALKSNASAAPVSTPDCNANAVAWCGSPSASDLINKYNNGDGHNSAASIQNIYNCVGITSTDIHAMTGGANGYVTNTGDVYLGGQLVATGAITGGRQDIGGAASTPHNCNGTTFWERPPQVSFQNPQLAAMVVMKNGVFQYAILISCDNAVIATPIIPNYTCDMLNATPVTDKLNTYNFTSHVIFGNGAVFDKVVYDFGDGSAPVSSLGTGDLISHTYTKPGTWTAKVTAYFTLPGGTVVATTPGGNCVRRITIQPPILSCIYLQAVLPDQKNKLSFEFTLKAADGNGATFTSADFDFGDGTNQMGVKPGTGSNALIVTTPHTYGKTGTYTVIPTLHFTTPTGNQTVVGTGNCVAHVSPTPPPQPCTPGGTPAPGSPQCSPTPCTPGGTPAPGSPECAPPTPTPPTTPPATLVNTGAGNVIGLFAGTSVLGAAAHFLFQKRRLGRASL